MNRKATSWLPLSLVGALVALVGGLAFISGALASPAAVSIGSATVAPGGSATVDVTVTPATGEIVGTAVIDVVYTADVTATACTPAATCNTAFATNTTRFALANLSGLSGAVGTLTLQAGQNEVVVPLTVTATCSNDIGDPLTCTVTNGSITIQAATPTPTPSPTPVPTATPTPTIAATATRTPTPAALPQTGGTESDGSTSIAWVLGFFGLAILAGGVWAVSRTRRHTV